MSNAADQPVDKATSGARVNAVLEQWRLRLMIGVPLAALAIFGWLMLTHGRWQQADLQHRQCAHRAPARHESAA